MDHPTEPIRQDIDAIRASMTDKMEQIEQKIRGTVEETTEQVKRTFDLKHQISERPWPALGIAVLAGYAIGSVSDDRPSPSYDTSSFRSYQPGMPRQSSFQHNDAQRQEWHRQTMNQSQQRGMFDDLAKQFSGEFAMVKTAAITSLVNLLRDTIRQNVPTLHQEMERMRGSHSTTSASRYPSATTGKPTTPMTGAASYAQNSYAPSTSAATDTTANNAGSTASSYTTFEREAGRGI